MSDETRKEAVQKRLMGHMESDTLPDRGQWFRLIADFTYDWEYLLGRDGRYLFVSPACERITGYAPEEFMQDAGLMLRIVHPDDRPLMARHLAEKREEEESHEFDFRIITRAGEERWIGHACRPVYGPDGAWLGWRGSNRDVTDRKETTAALRRERDFASAILRTAGALVVVLDREGRIERFNEACERTTGYLAEEVEGQPFWDIFLIDQEIEPVKAVFARLRAGEFPSRHENFWISKDGQRRWIAWSNTALQDEAGQVEHVIGIGIDVTEQRQAEAEREQLLAQARRDREEIEKLAGNLAREWAILQTIMENTPANLAYLDAEFHFVRVNTAYARHAGYSEEDLLGRNHFDLFPNEENQAIFQRVRDTGEAVEFRAKPFEYADQPARGVTYWDWTLVPVKNPRGEVEGLVFSLLDVSDKVQAQETLRQQNEALQQLTHELDAYAHTVAHDLKQPLGVLIGLASMLEEDLADLSREEVARLATKIVETGYKMTQIIDGLLLLASARQADVAVGTLDMEDVVGQVLKTLAPALDAAGAELVVPDQWPAALGFAPWVESVWTNYISNALKYGGTPPHIEIGYTLGEPGSSKTLFWVRDNGAGLAPEEQAQLFNPFTRLNRRQKLGHGLGLTIVHRIVTRLGGEVGVDSEPGKGSTFWFTLP
ncbi:MAG: PAS domain-containing sensor histidine kinase [Anaerolineae bacterium]|nr:PAS domain-containing sensor histidine kinase [Anaerolineae bacterium]